MIQADLFTVPVPHGGSIAPAKRTSRLGAEVACTRAGSQASRMLLAYLERGPLSDTQVSKIVGIPEARVSARRSGLLQKGLARYVDDVRGPFGSDVNRWHLTTFGRAVAIGLTR